jgi:hypothetical protein
MNRSKLMRRLSVVAALAVVLALVAGAPALQAQPEAANLGLTPYNAWAGHPQCVGNAKIDVLLSGDPVSVGGYETKLSFDASKFGYTSPNVFLTNFLAVNGRSTSGASGTPLLEAATANSVKFGDYSWGSNPTGPNAPGTLAQVRLTTLACGTSDVSLSESQVVNTQGTVFPSGTQALVPYVVYGLYDTNRSGGNITIADAIAVTTALGTSGACNANYQYDVNNSGGNITIADAIAVAAQLGQPSCP